MAAEAPPPTAVQPAGRDRHRRLGGARAGRRRQPRRAGRARPGGDVRGPRPAGRRALPARGRRRADPAPLRRLRRGRRRRSRCSTSCASSRRRGGWPRPAGARWSSTSRRPGSWPTRSTRPPRRGSCCRSTRAARSWAWSPPRSATRCALRRRARPCSPSSATCSGAGIAAARLRQRIARTEVERERLRLAADIHDGLAQDLALAKREIALLDSDPGARRRRARAARACARRWARRTASSARASRTSPRACRSAACTTRSLAACERARERGLPVELRAGAAVEPAEPEVAAVVLRVLGEALANVERHAQAGHVLVDPRRRRSGALALTVEDDGRGLGALDDGGPGDGHFGIALMRERAASIGGRLAVGPGAAGGTRVRLEVPRA